MCVPGPSLAGGGGGAVEERPVTCTTSCSSVPGPDLQIQGVRTKAEKMVRHEAGLLD